MNDAPPRGVMGALGTKRRVAQAIAVATIGALAVLVATGTSPGAGFAPGVSVEGALAAQIGPVVRDAAAQTIPGTARPMRYEEYGEHCWVGDSVNTLTDKVTHMLGCESWSVVNNFSGINFRVDSDTGEVTVGLFVGRQDRRDDRADILILFDSGTLRTGRWGWDSDRAWAVHKPTIEWFDAVLTELSNGELLFLSVGEKDAGVQVAGAREAVADFVSRIEHVQQVGSP